MLSHRRHVAVLAAVMSAKMDLPQRILDRPLVVTSIREPPPPTRKFSRAKVATPQCQSTAAKIPTGLR